MKNLTLAFLFLLLSFAVVGQCDTSRVFITYVDTTESPVVTYNSFGYIIYDCVTPENGYPYRKAYYYDTNYDALSWRYIITTVNILD
jgi:hypothetical protein